MKQNSATLGFLPFDALADYQKRGGIIGAKTEDDRLVGYLLHSIHHVYFRIVHLCVSESCRGNGIARKLVDHLRSTATSQGLIKLHCRSDYAVNAMWPVLGFVPFKEKPGRSAAGHLLTLWCLKLAQNQQLDLFQALTLDERLDAVVDAQIFFDFHEPDSIKAKPSKVLLSDFLVDTLNLWITDELFVEIHRNRDYRQREMSRGHAHEFPQISHNPKTASFFEDILRKCLPANNDSQVSDIRHLAKTAASESVTFVTRDSDLLQRANRIYDLIGIHVLSPTELIIRIYELSGKHDNVSSRISGGDVSWRQLHSTDLAQFPVRSFVEPNEKHGSFTERLNAFLARPDCYECALLDIRGDIAAFRILATHELDCVTSPFTGVAYNHDRKLIQRFVVADTIAKGISTGRSLIKFEKDGVSLNLISTLLDMGFVAHQDTFIRFTIPHCITREQVMSGLTLRAPQIRDTFRSMNDIELEQCCSPLSIPNSRSTFMVPIKPDYAMSLFDSCRAGQDLFGGNSDVLLRWENVYYRKATHVKMMKAPGRILWYVSSPEKEIVAVSLLDTVAIDTPKQLFRSFRKFGIFDWRELYQLCDGDVSTYLMALRFSHTFQFRHRIPLDELRTIFKEHERIPVLQSPSRISTEICKAIFERGYRNQS